MRSELPREGEQGVSSDRLARKSAARVPGGSAATVPDLDVAAEAKIGAALSSSGSRTAVLVKACALALRETPRANASYRDGRFELYSRVNVAVSSEGDDPGSSPIVFDADQKSLR